MGGARLVAASCASPPNPTARDPVRRRSRSCALLSLATKRHGCTSTSAPLLATGLHQARPRDPSPSASPRLRFAAAAAMDAEASAAAEAGAKPFAVLFVCLGNICRSPAAEAVFRNLVSKRGLDSKFNIDSAGTIGYHEGNKADSRMRSASKKRGVEVTSISRPIKPSDFRDFNLILAMDRQNYEDIMSSFERWRHKEPLPDSAPKKVKLMCSYCKRHTESEVPDPFYGGPQGFEKARYICHQRKQRKLAVGGSEGRREGEAAGWLAQASVVSTAAAVPCEHSSGGSLEVLDLLEDACESLLDSIVAENANIA